MARRRGDSLRRGGLLTAIALSISACGGRSGGGSGRVADANPIRRIQAGERVDGASSVLVVTTDAPVVLQIDGWAAGDLGGAGPLEARFRLPSGRHLISGRSREFADVEARSYVSTKPGTEEKIRLWVASPVEMKRTAVAFDEEIRPRVEGAKERLSRLDLRWVDIPSGEFRMGCPDSDLACRSGAPPAKRVRITKPFQMMATPVTREQFETWALSRGYEPTSQPADKGGDAPVVNVTWYEAQSFCASFEGRLPSEAEWEYAARAGFGGVRHGATEDESWYWPNKSERFHANPVAKKRPNAFGLYDVLGNVSEWCADWDVRFARRMTSEEFLRWKRTEPPLETDPPGAASPEDESGPLTLERAVQLREDKKVYRGPWELAQQNGAPRDHRSESLGFRCARGGAFPRSEPVRPGLLPLAPLLVQAERVRLEVGTKPWGTCGSSWKPPTGNSNGGWWERTLVLSLMNSEKRNVVVGVTFHVNGEKTTRFYSLGGQQDGRHHSGRTFSEVLLTCAAGPTPPEIDVGWEVTSIVWGPLVPGATYR